MGENKFISKRINKITFSTIREIFEEANQMENSGDSVVHLEIGRPDFDTSDNIKQATHKALNKGYVHYSSSAGVLKLREAIAKKLKKENDLEVNPKDGVVVTAGCKE